MEIKKNKQTNKQTCEKQLTMNETVILSGYTSVSDGGQDSSKYITFITNNFTYKVAICA